MFRLSLFAIFFVSSYYDEMQNLHTIDRINTHARKGLLAGLLDTILFAITGSLTFVWESPKAEAAISPVEAAAPFASESMVVDWEDAEPTGRSPCGLSNQDMFTIYLIYGRRGEDT